MNRRGKIVLAAAAITVASLVTLGSMTASAHGWMGNSNEFATSLAQKLGVGEDKVSEALGSLQEERQAEMKARWEEQLTSLVNEGEITNEQKQLIVNKRQEMQDKMQAEREALQKWADQNGIDLKYLAGPGYGRGHMMR